MTQRSASSPIPADLRIIEPLESDFPAFIDRSTYGGYKGRSNLIRPHVHLMFEFGRIDKGRATLMIGGKHLDFIEGDVCVITPAEAHQAFFPADCSCSWMYFDVPRLLAHVAADPAILSLEPFQGPGFTNVFRGAAGADVSEIAVRMIDEFEHRPPYFKDSLRLLLATLLVRLHRHVTQDRRERDTKPAAARGSIERISPAITYMHEHYGERVPVKDLASRVFMSISNFREEFGRCIGCSPHEYLTAYRIAASQAQLAQGEKRIEQIAMECGFADPSSFRRAYKKRMGQPPIAARLAARGSA